MNQQIPDKSNISVQMASIIGARPLLFFILAFIFGISFFASIIAWANLDDTWKGALVIIAIVYMILLVVIVSLFS